MSFQQYLANNWGLLVILTGLTILIASDIHLERRMVRQIAITNGLLLFYSVTSQIESAFGNRETFSVWRSWLSAVNYSLLTVILVSVTMIVYPGHKRLLFIPCAVNTVMVFVSIPTGLVFSFTDTNNFRRGPLGYLPFVINALYLAYLCFRVFKSRRWQRRELVRPVFMTMVAAACIIMPLAFETQSDQWLEQTIAAELLLYYVFLLQGFTTCDSLTGLLNRQCYYSDLERYKDSITAMVAIDMNGLKRTNDSFGHTEGDRALKTLANSFIASAGRKHHIYRIGGDEFIILCIGANEEEVRYMIERIGQELEKTPYSVSVGYAMNESGLSSDELYHRADAMLYEDKRKYYLSAGLESKAGHSRRD